MGKVRVFSLAKQLGLRSQALVAALAELGMGNVTPATAIDEATANAAKELLAEQAKQAREVAEQERAAEAARAPEPPAAEAPVVAEAPPAQASETAEPAAAPAEAPAAPQAAQTGRPEAAKQPSATQDKRRRSKGAAAEPAVQAPPPPATVEAASESAKRKGEAKDVDTKEDKETEKYFRRRGPARLDEDDGLAELERQLAQLAEEEEAERARRAKAGEVVPLPELARRPTTTRPEQGVDVPPVVTILGHVDHGKTSLLDAIRSTSVAEGESGGITQHIGASEVTVGEKRIVFLDTPGHEAFTAMRARGAMVTDIAVLVVAADDGIMPQTVEAINHAKAAKVPIIVAVNKIDRPDADPDRVKQQLLEHELVAEEWGGETIVVPVSAHTKEGLDNLLEMILIVAEVQQLWADTKADFVGVVVESSVDPSQGTVCTVLVRNGTVKVGDSVVCGSAHGRIRRLRDWQGKTVKEMGPGSPVAVVGLTGVPEAGEVMIAAANPKEARRLADERAISQREDELSGSGGVSLRDLYQEATGTGRASLNVVLKADVWGSVQAIESKLMQLDRRVDELDINMVSAGVGNVTESDVMLAKASEAIVMGFHCEVDSQVRQTAETEGVELRLYEVIYDLMEDVEKALLGLLQPVFEDVVLGKAQVLQLFRISRIGVIAGCTITEGRMERGALMKVTRGKEEVYTGPLQSLRHFDQDVRVVEAPGQCGISTNDWRGWQVGDEVELWGKVQLERKLVLRDESDVT